MPILNTKLKPKDNGNLQLTHYLWDLIPS